MTNSTVHKTSCPISVSQRGQWAASVPPECNCQEPMNIIQTIRNNYKKHSFALIKTRKVKPFGYVGYMLTIYDKKDDVTPIIDIKGRNLSSILSQLKKQN